MTFVSFYLAWKILNEVRLRNDIYAIIKAPLISLKCDNTTQLLGVGFTCNISTYSINQTNQILVDFADGTNVTLKTNGKQNENANSVFE